MGSRCRLSRRGQSLQMTQPEGKLAPAMTPMDSTITSEALHRSHPPSVSWHHQSISGAAIVNIQQHACPCSWAAYVAGTLLVLMHECGARVPPGMHLCALVASDVPPGAGVSSSAALEVASMAAFAAVLQLDVPPRQLAILCQMVRFLSPCYSPCYQPWMPKCRLSRRLHAKLVAW